MRLIKISLPLLNNYLFDHWRLGHDRFYWVQSLMKLRIFKDDNTGGRNEESNIFPQYTYASIFRCHRLLCAACSCGKSQRRDTNTTRQRLSYKTLRSGKIDPGELVFVDQYISSVKGRLPRTYGKENGTDQFCGGIIFVDSTSGFTRIYHLVSLRAGDILR